MKELNKSDDTFTESLHVWKRNASSANHTIVTPTFPTPKSFDIVLFLIEITCNYTLSTNN